jgi:hypothetical protein
LIASGLQSNISCLEKLGLPPLDKTEDPSCGFSADVPACTWSGKLPGCTRYRAITPADKYLDLLTNFGRRSRVYDSFTTPVYSNVGFDILGKLVENASGKSYSQYLQDSVFQVANLNRTSVDIPSDQTIGFIPAEPGWWDVSLGVETRWALMSRRERT